ncbi:MAG: ABC transporter permease subunit [Microbacteriaceae bacterium]|nr:ABC transporter permease subunit [Microbacteriaceae bacterium]
MTTLSNVVSPSSSAPEAPAQRGAKGAKPRKNRTFKLGPTLGTIPFFVYIAVFLLLPTGIMAAQAFLAGDGSFTLKNFEVMTQKNTIEAFVTSFWVSTLSSAIGVVFGGLAAYALVLGAEHNSLLRRIVVSLSSVLAQFGGVMLAFAFITTVGATGTLTLVFESLSEMTGNPALKIDPTWLSTLPGLVTVYSYFQIPLMILVFIPALDGIRPQWREANAVFGGSNLQYWRNVGLPILWPSILGSFLLLFANAFSAFATAAALFAQRSILVPLQIKSALSNELDTELDGIAATLATAMIVVVSVIVLINYFLTKRSDKWVK